LTVRPRLAGLRRRAALVFAGSLVATGLLAAPAAAAPMASTSYHNDCVQYDAWATGCFQPYGDHVRVWDNRTDGLRAEVYWSTDYGRWGTCAIPSGENHVDCNYNFAENHQIYIELNMVDVQTGETVWHDWTQSIT